MHNLPILNAMKILPAAPQTAAGTTEVEGAAIDCEGGYSIVYFLILGTVTANGVGTAKVQESDTSTDGDFTDVTGLSKTWADTNDDDVIVLEHTKITKRYSRIVITPTVANTVIGGAVACVFADRKQPVTQGSDTLTDFV